MFRLSLILFSAQILTTCSDVKEPETLAQEFVYDLQPNAHGFLPERLNTLDSFYQKKVGDGIFPNAVLFIARNHHVVYFKAFGFSDMEKKREIKKDDIFRIASQSKAITTVGLMTLFEKGFFLMNDPISRYIPAFNDPQVLISYDPHTRKAITRPASREITIHDLLTHTAGIPYDHPMMDSLPRYNSLKPVMIGEVVEKIAKIPLLHDPGEKFTYGMNTDIIGYLIEVLSGMPLDQYLDRYLFKPLGMNDTYFYLPAEKADRLVTLYQKPEYNLKLQWSVNNDYQSYAVSGARTFFSGGAGLVGTIEDYARFCQMLLNGGAFNNHRILSRKTIEMMTINHIGDLDVWGRGTKFGLGLEINTEKGLNYLPGTAGSYKWGGMYATDYLIDPEEGLVALLYTNVQPFAHWEDIEKFRVLLYQSLK